MQKEISKEGREKDRLEKKREGSREREEKKEKTQQ